MPKSKNKRRNGKVVTSKPSLATRRPTRPPGAEKINLAIWGACPHVITGFGVVMKELLQYLFRSHPGVYDIYQLSINYHGDFCDELSIVGSLANGRHRQWPAAVDTGSGRNLYGQPKFLQLLKNLDVDLDAVLLFEDPFWVGGTIPGINPPAVFIDEVRKVLTSKGQGHVPVIGYFPIDGIPKPEWIQNIAKLDLPITYLPFGATACSNIVPELSQKLRIIPHGVNPKEFFPIPKEEARLFKRSMFGDRFADKFMFLNVNRNQLRKLVPSTLIAFSQFKAAVPESFLFLNMSPVDVGWNLPECCRSLGLEIGKDVFFPPNFNVQKGLSVEDLNKLFNAADVLVSTAVGGGWELAVSQAFATKTCVLMPNNTSHTDLCGDQSDLSKTRGMLYECGSGISQQIIFPNDNEVIRPLPNTQDMVSKMLFLYNNPEYRSRLESNAYDWAINNLSWERNIGPLFHKAFSESKAVKKARLANFAASRASAPSVQPPQEG